MRTGRFALLMALLALAGCDRITGAEKQKILDAEAVGYACRVSQKVPEDCMKENDTKSPSSVLEGWKNADKDIQGQLIDPTMGKRTAAAVAAHSAPAATENEGKAATAKTAEKAAEAKSEKPAAAARHGAPPAPKAAGH